MTFHASAVADVIKRQESLHDAVRKGRLTEDVGRYMRPGFAYVYKQGESPELGFSRLNAAQAELANDDDGSIPFIITTSDEDRDGDIVVPRGCQLDNYSLNPVVFFGHQEWEIPIGVCRSPDGQIAVYPEEKRVTAVVYFDRADPDADFLYGKCKRKIINATSIAFVPIKAMRREDIAKARTHSQQMVAPGWYFELWDMTELSCVGVPSNPKAVGLEKDLQGACRDVYDREKSFMSPKLQKAWRPYVAEPKGCWRGWCPAPGDEKDLGNGVILKAVKKGATMGKTKSGCSCNDCSAGKACPCGKEQPSEEAKDQPSTDIDPDKACQILRDGEIDGQPLTEAQRGMFGAACARAQKSWGGLRETCKALVEGVSQAGSRMPRKALGESEGGEGQEKASLLSKTTILQQAHDLGRQYAQARQRADSGVAAQHVMREWNDWRRFNDKDIREAGVSLTELNQAFSEGGRSVPTSAGNPGFISAGPERPGGRKGFQKSSEGKRVFSDGKLVYEFDFKGNGGVNFRKLRANGFVLMTGAYTDEQAQHIISRLVNDGYTEKALGESEGRIGGYLVDPKPIQANDAPKQRTASTETEGWTACEACHGAGNCSECGGSGTLPIGDCGLCGGSGECSGCGGEGHMKKSIRKAPDKVKVVRVLGTNPASGEIYWLGSDGNVYYGNRQERASNEGSEAEFNRKLEQGQLRFKPKSLGKQNSTDHIQPQESAIEQPSVPQVLAALYSHAKAEAAYIDELNDTYKGTLAGYRDGLDKRVAALKDMFTDLSPDDDLDKMCKAFEDEHDQEQLPPGKAFETTGPDSTFEPGEAGLIEQGDVPPETEEAAEPVEPAEEKETCQRCGGTFNEATHVCPDCGGDQRFLKMRSYAENEGSKAIKETVPAAGAYVEGDAETADELNSESAPFNKAAPGTEEWAEEEVAEPEHREKIIYGDDCEGDANDDPECAAMFANVGKTKRKAGAISCACGKEMPPDANFCPDCGASMNGENPEEKIGPLAAATIGGIASNLTGNKDVDSEPITEEILERYREPKSNKWGTRKWIVARSLLPFLKYRVAANGKKYLVRTKGQQVDVRIYPALASPGKFMVGSVKHGGLASDAHESMLFNSKEEAEAWARQNGYNVVKQVSEGSSLDNAEVKALTTKLATAIDDIKALVKAPDLPKHYKAGLKHVADQIWYVGKALTDKGKEQKDGGKGSELSDKGKEQRNGGKGSTLSDKGELQRKGGQAKGAPRQVSPAVESKLNDLTRFLRRQGILNGSN